MNDTEKVLKTAQAIDTLDLLDHIAWTDVLKPQLTQAQKYLTERLVGLTLGTLQPGSETKEQVAGKLYGINEFIKKIEKVLSAGNEARKMLAEENIFLD